MAAIDPGRDTQGLKEALIELMEEGFLFRQLSSKLDSADDATQEQLMRRLPERKLTVGYYKLGDYLLWLDQRLDALRGPLADAAAFEADGLCVLARARNEFEHKHPPCWKCGERQEIRFATQCWSCGAEFKTK